MKSYSFTFYFWSLLFSVFFASLNTASAQVELKVNLPLAAVLVPNLGIEFQQSDVSPSLPFLFLDQ